MVFKESLKSLNSLGSLENGLTLLCFPQSGGSLESLESLDFSAKTPFPKDLFFATSLHVVEVRDSGKNLATSTSCIFGF